MRSLMKDEDETAKIIHNMAKIFRNSLVWKRHGDAQGRGGVYSLFP